MTTDFTDDLQLGELLRAEVPAPADDYWTSIHDAINRSSVSAGALGEPDPERAQPIDVVDGDPVVPFRTRLRRGVRGAAALAVAAALLLIVGMLVGTRLQRSSDSIDVGFAGRTIDGYTVEAGDGNGPRQNLDHWHAVYGVWDCTANGGRGGWLDKFDSTEDDVGIHSHDDGMIYIHPFFEESAEENATFSHFADSMNFELTDESLILPDGRPLLEGTACDGGPATLHLRRWSTDFAARSQTVLAPQIVTENLGAERFYNDREVWTLAFAPLDADIPLPPAKRFAELDKWGTVEYSPTVLNASIATSIAIELDATSELGLKPPVLYYEPDGFNSEFDELIREPRPAWTDFIVDGSFRAIATADHVPDQSRLLLATYRVELSDGATRWCVAMIDLPGQRTQGPSYCDTPTSPVQLVIEEDESYIFLRNVLSDVAYVVLETGDGQRIVTNTVERHAYVGSNFARDAVTKIELYDESLLLVATCPRATPTPDPECLLAE